MTLEWRQLDSKTWTCATPDGPDLYIEEVTDRATGERFYRAVELGRHDGDPVVERSKRFKTREEAIQYLEKSPM